MTPSAARAVILEADAQREVEQRAEAALERGLAVDLAADVAAEEQASMPEPSRMVPLYIPQVADLRVDEKLDGL